MFHLKLNTNSRKRRWSLMPTSKFTSVPVVTTVTFFTTFSSLPELAFFYFITWSLLNFFPQIWTTLKFSIIDCKSFAVTWKCDYFCVRQECKAEVKVYFHAFLASAIDGGDWSILYYSWLYPRKGTQYPLSRKVCGLPSRSDRFGQEERRETAVRVLQKLAIHV
jgi:hypothetical protein